MLKLTCSQTSSRDRHGAEPAKRLRSVICVVAVLIFSFSGLTGSVWAKTPAVQEMAPDFALKSSSGHNLRLSEFRGDIVIVNFWSTNCARCRDQLDRLAAINTADSQNRLSILSVNVDSDSSKAQRAIADRNYGFPVLLDTDKTAIRKYDPDKLPMIVMIDPHGTVRYIHEGFHRGDEALYAQELAELMAE